MPAKLSQFPACDRPLSGSEQFGIVQAGDNARVTGQEFYEDIVRPQILNLQNQIDTLTAGASLLPISTISAASYTIQSTDAYNAYELTYPGSVSITIPLNSVQAVPVGARIRFANIYDTAVFVLGDPSIEIVSRNGVLTSIGPGAIFEAYKVGLNRWWLLGDLQE